MIKQSHLKPNKTYATKANVLKALASFNEASFQYMIVRNDEGRWFPICIGPEALRAGTHFHFVTMA